MSRMPREATDEQIQRADDWVNEHYPNAEDEEREERFGFALAQIMTNDARALRAEARLA